MSALNHQDVAWCLVFSAFFASGRILAENQDEGGKRGLNLFWSTTYNCALALPGALLVVPLTEIAVALIPALQANNINVWIRLVLSGYFGWQGIKPTMEMLDKFLKGEAKKHGLNLSDQNPSGDSAGVRSSDSAQTDSQSAD